MESNSDPIERLIGEFEKLPSIGRRTAQRLTFHLMKAGEEGIASFIEAVIGLKEGVKHCSICFNLTVVDPCRICSDPKRDRSTICVVEEPKDVFVLERTGQYRGLYHVLGGVLSPLDGINPEDLKIKELLARLKSEVKEVILAMSAGVQGETTSLYLFKLLKPFGVKVSQIARGLPVGGDLEIADEQTLVRALKGRQLME